MQDKSVLDLISDPSAGTPEDKMRLFIIYYILSPDLSESDLAQHQTALEAVGADTAPLSYLKQWKYVSLALLLSISPLTMLYQSSGHFPRWLPILVLRALWAEPWDQTPPPPPQ